MTQSSIYTDQRKPSDHQITPQIGARVKATCVTVLYWSLWVAVLVVDTEVSTLLLGTYITGVVFLVQHGVSPSPIAPINYTWLPSTIRHRPWSVTGARTGCDVGDWFGFDLPTSLNCVV
jgi:hypothetical protein